MSICELRTFVAICDVCGKQEGYQAQHWAPPPGWTLTKLRSTNGTIMREVVTCMTCPAPVVDGESAGK